MNERHPEDEEERQSSTAQFLHAIRERWWVILLCGLVCGAAALGYSLTQPKVYQATSTVLFRNIDFSQAILGSSFSIPSTDPTRDASTNTELIMSREVAATVRKKLNLKMSTDDLLGIVSVQQNENSDVVGIQINDQNPRLAAAIATSYAEEFVKARQQADRAKVADAEQLIRDRLASLPANAPDRASLEQSLQKLVALEAIQTGNAEVVDTASVPTVAVSPTPKRNAVLGFILGLVLGGAIALALDYLDRRVRSARNFERLYDVPLLVQIPHHSVVDYDPSQQSARAFEPYRMLRNAISSLSTTARPVRTVLITSAMPDEGKTLVSVNLARAMALAGDDAILVEADVRDPDLHRHFDLDPDAAELTETLRDGTSEDALQRISPGHWSHAGELPSGDIIVLPSGEAPANASELLSGTAMGGLLEWLGDVGDVVIVDAPPLLPVADTHSLLDQMQVDACILVARVNQTTRDQVERARAILDQHRVSRVIGVVVTDTEQTESTYGYYGADEVLVSEGPGSGRRPLAAEPADDEPLPAPPPAPAAYPPPAPPVAAPPPAAPMPPPQPAPMPPAYPAAPAAQAPHAYPPPAVVPPPAVPSGYAYPPPATNGGTGANGASARPMPPVRR